MGFDQTNFRLLDEIVYMVKLFKLDMNKGITLFATGLTGTVGLHAAPSRQRTGLWQQYTLVLSRQQSGLCGI